MRRARAGLLLAASLLPPWASLGAAEDAAVVSTRSRNVPVCAFAGVGYDDPVVTFPNGGSGLADSSACQSLCAKQLNCSVFTFYVNSGGCWLQGSGLTSKPIPGAISGPRACGAGGTSPVSATVQPVVQAAPTPAPFRFIKAGSELWFENAHRKYLVRFHCVACPSACESYDEVSPTYVASLAFEGDFNCDMLVTTTTLIPGVLITDSALDRAQSHLRSPHETEWPNPWSWVLAIGIILCCCIGGFFYWDSELRRNSKKRRMKGQKERHQGRNVVKPGENMPLMSGSFASSNGQSFASSNVQSFASSQGQGQLPPFPALGPGGAAAMPTQAMMSPANLPTQAAMGTANMPTQAFQNSGRQGAGGTFTA